MNTRDAQEKLSLDIWNTIFIGDRLRQAREKMGLTQEELAYFFRFNVGAVSHWECGRREPSLSNLVRLCHALEIDPNQLLQGSNY